MTHEDAFLQDILEHRDDDTPRRIFADWLLDQDDPVQAARGEFIHVQCTLARSPLGTPRPVDLVHRERQLLEFHGRQWGSLFQQLGCHGWQYRRGFVEAVGISAGAFLTNATPLFATAPLRELKLYDICGRMSALANCSHLACVETIDLERNDLGDAEMKYLAGASLTQLTTLLLWSNRVGDKGLAALVAAAFPRLRRLDLSYNLIGDVGATALASSPVLGQLALLDLTANQITSRGARALADSPHATTLGRLDLTKNPIDESGQTALRRRFSDRIQVWS